MLTDLDRLSPAERFLWGFGILTPEHIDLEAIANNEGALVKYRSMDGCEARLLVAADQAIISVNQNSRSERQRFSLAHELSHWIFDKEKKVFLCAKEDIGPQNAKAKSIEAIANNHASQLILPSYMVRPWMKGRKVSLDLSSKLGKEFNASLTASAIKLTKLSDSPAYLACHSAHGLKWFQPPSSLSTNFYIKSELHYDSDAFSMLFGNATGMTRPKRDKAVNWLTGQDVYKYEISTQSVKLPDNTVLTMINLI